MDMDALPSPEPHVQICDAAIAVLAKQGVAGLTPQAVDDQLGWAVGSTYSHFATQGELLEAVAHRLVFLDALELQGFRPSAAGIAAVIERTFTPENRKRFLARLELYLHAARTPEFATMHWARDLFAAGAEAHMRIAGARTPRLAAVAVIVMIEGLLLHDFIAPRMTHRDRFGLVRRMLHGFMEDMKARDRL